MPNLEQLQADGGKHPQGGLPASSPRFTNHESTRRLLLSVLDVSWPLDTPAVRGSTLDGARYAFTMAPKLEREEGEKRNRRFYHAAILSQGQRTHCRVSAVLESE